jgi:hypothetical protein
LICIIINEVIINIKYSELVKYWFNLNYMNVNRLEFNFVSKLNICIVRYIHTNSWLWLKYIL